MKNLFRTISFVLVITSLSINANAQNWTSKANMPEAREGAVCFTIGSKIYWGGGTATTQTDVKRDFYEYDPATDTWTKLADMPEERLWGISFSIDGKGYVGLGKTSGSGSGTYLQSLYEYDAATDKWTQKASISAPYGLVSSSVFVVNGKAYVLGGTNSNFASFGTLYEYDPLSDQWATKSPYPITNQGSNWVRHAITFGMGNKGYIVSGEIRKASGAGTEFTKKSFEYDPATDTWSPIADFIGDGRAAGAAFVINGTSFCGLGYSKDASFNNVFYKDVFSYNAGSDQWTTVGTFPGDGRVLASVSVINNKGYVGGGSKLQTGHFNDWHELTIPNAISNYYQEAQLTTYPNPASDKIYINTSTDYTTYTIYSVDGKTVANGNIKNNAISIASVPNGQYIVELKNNMQAQRGLITISK